MGGAAKACLRHPDSLSVSGLGARDETNPSSEQHEEGEDEMRDEGVYALRTS